MTKTAMTKTAKTKTAKKNNEATARKANGAAGKAAKTARRANADASAARSRGNNDLARDYAQIAELAADMAVVFALKATRAMNNEWRKRGRTAACVLAPFVQAAINAAADADAAAKLAAGQVKH